MCGGLDGSLYFELRDEEGDEAANQAIQQGDGPALPGTGNPFLDVPNVTGATEFKKGYVMRKCCYDSNGKKSIDPSFILLLQHSRSQMYLCKHVVRVSLDVRIM